MRKVLCSLLAAMLLFTASCAPSAQPSGSTSQPASASSGSTTSSGAKTPVKGGTLIMADNQEVAGFCWYKLSSPSSHIQGVPLWEGLMRHDENGIPQPFLCESMDPDPDALTYTIKLRKGIKFSDGSELNAESCAWSLNTFNELSPKASSHFSNIESFEVVDEYTVVINLKSWDTTIPMALARECGYMASKEAYEKMGQEAFEATPVATGPFTLSTWERDVEKTFVKNKDYWQGEPLLDAVKIMIYKDALVAQAALEKGEIHAYYSLDFDLIRTMEGRGFVIESGTLPTMISILAFNTMNPSDPLYNMDVRKAVSHAIDSEVICDVVFRGYSMPTNQFAATNSIYFNKDVEGYPYDVEKSKELLAKAGYPNGFSTRIQVRNEPVNVNAVTAIQAMLADVGIKVELDILDPGDFSKALTGWDTGMCFHSSGFAYAVVSQTNGIFAQGVTGSVLGLTSIDRPKDVSDALKAALSARSDEESIRSMQEAQKLMVDEHCMYKITGTTHNSYIKSPKLHDDGINAIQYALATLHTAWIEE